MNGKWLAERIFNGPFCKHETKEMALMRVTPEYVCSSPQNDSHHLPSPTKFESTKNGSSGYLSLKSFLEKYSLPRIVKIIPEEPILTTESTDPAALLNGTLLLYKQYRSGKIEAKKFPDSRSGTKTSSSEALKDLTSTIVIPDTYQGWFSVMTERGQVKARQYTTVQRLIAAQVTAFLIIGPDLIGYYQNNQKIAADGARSRYQYIKTVVRSGQILKLLAVYEDIAEQSTRSKRLSWPLLGSKQQSTQYAQCMTIKKQIVYIPITTHGYFYAVSTANNTAEDNVSKVYQIAKLLQVFPLPVRVCSIYPQKINGSILLETYHKEDVMLACVLDDKPLSGSGKTRFLEIDINSKFFVNLVPDEQRLFKKTRVQRALRNCHTDSEKWCQQLKVIHHIYPSPSKTTLDSGSGGTSNSQPEKPKRSRKVSLGDKKTVKSASFRYSTSYGLDDVRPPYRHLPPNEVYHSKSASHIPPVYLNIACKPANEENCSSLPTQKVDRTQFENEILQSVLRNEQLNRERQSEEHHQRAKERPYRKGAGLDLSYLKANESKSQMVTNNILESRHKQQPQQQQQQPPQLQQHRVTSKLLNGGFNDPEPMSKLSDLRYRVIKKENTYIERDFSKVARQPVYKTQVVVKIDDSYSNALDAIRSNNSQHSSKDNIYAEINEYPELISKNFSSVFPQKTSCFVSDGCTSSYIRVPSTSTVNVS